MLILSNAELPVHSLRTIEKNHGTEESLEVLKVCLLSTVEDPLIKVMCNIMVNTKQIDPFSTSPVIANSFSGTEESLKVLKVGLLTTSEDTQIKVLRDITAQSLSEVLGSTNKF